MRKKVAVFVAILVAYGLLGPVFPVFIVDIITIIFSSNSRNDLQDMMRYQTFVISFLVGFIPALSAGLYLALKAVKKTPFIQYDYILIAAASPFLTVIVGRVIGVKMLTDFWVYATIVAVFIAGITAIIFESIFRKILSTTQFALVDPTLKSNSGINL